MLLETKIFGTIEKDDLKVINFPKGIIGFPDLKEFALIHETNGEEKMTGLQWLVSLNEPAFAMPVMDPLIVKPGYNPMVEDEQLKAIGELTADNLLILVTTTITAKIEDISVNLMAPIIINIETMKGIQVAVENTDYPVKYKIYDILKKPES